MPIKDVSVSELAHLKLIRRIKEIAIQKNLNPVGSIFSTRKFGDVLVVTERMGRKYVEFKWAKVGNWNHTGWTKLPFGRDITSLYKFVRRATPKEMQAAGQGIQNLYDRKQEIVKVNREAIDSQEIRPGDVVKVKYTNGPRNEAVLDINYKTGKIGIVRQGDWAAEVYSKRRFIPTKFATKVADGGGNFNPNNPLYEKHGIHIPTFYKSGQTVAPRRKKSRLSWL